MHHFYNYEDLIFEIHGEIYEGRLVMDDWIKIVRGEAVFEDYHPIIAYYFIHDTPEEPYEEAKVSDVMKEMQAYTQH